MMLKLILLLALVAVVYAGYKMARSKKLWK